MVPNLFKSASVLFITAVPPPNSTPFILWFHRGIVAESDRYPLRALHLNPSNLYTHLIPIFTPVSVCQANLNVSQHRDISPSDFTSISITFEQCFNHFDLN